MDCLIFCNDQYTYPILSLKKYVSKSSCCIRHCSRFTHCDAQLFDLITTYSFKKKIFSLSFALAQQCFCAKKLRYLANLLIATLKFKFFGCPRTTCRLPLEKGRTNIFQSLQASKECFEMFSFEWQYTLCLQMFHNKRLSAPISDGISKCKNGNII